MALVTFTKYETKRLLGLARAAEVDRLVDEVRCLTPCAYSPAGRPLFDAAGIERAAAALATERQRATREGPA